jgi:hypothetical protein
MDLLHEPMEVDALLALDRRALVEAVHEEAFSAPDAAPQVEAAHDALACEQADERGLEALEADQVVVEAFEMLDRAQLRRVEGEAVGFGALPDPVAEIRSVRS